MEKKLKLEKKQQDGITLYRSIEGYFSECWFTKIEEEEDRIIIDSFGDKKAFKKDMITPLFGGYWFTKIEEKEDWFILTDIYENKKAFKKDMETEIPLPLEEKNKGIVELTIEELKKEVENK